MRLQEPAVIFEAEHVDNDGARVYIYTVAGWLDGENVASIQGGCTVGGDVILVDAESRVEADAKACLGLEDTINALHNERKRELAAQEALSRLEAAGAARRVEVAAKPDADKSTEFEADMAAIRPLVGDDIILTTTVH